jgi:peptidyl-prolyl cis-trans isomerase C
VDVAHLGEPRVKRPLLRFLLLGAALFVLDRTWGDRIDSQAPFPRGAVVSDDELLLHEAIARGFHESDTVVRRRLAMNLAFAEGERGRSEDALVREALALGMHESDLVVQRRLVQKMRLALADSARTEEPSDAELASYLARHRAHFVEPARVRAVQVYFATRERAEGMSAQLPANPAVAFTLGEPLPFGAQLAALSQDELARQLGAAFASAVFALRPGAWSPPIESSYGFHRVWVQERTPARETPLAIVRGEVREALLAERGSAAVSLALAAQRARYGLSERRAP